MEDGVGSSSTFYDRWRGAGGQNTAEPVPETAVATIDWTGNTPMRGLSSTAWQCVLQACWIARGLNHPQTGGVHLVVALSVVPQAASFLIDEKLSAERLWQAGMSLLLKTERMQTKPIGPLYPIGTDLETIISEAQARARRTDHEGASIADILWVMQNSPHVPEISALLRGDTRRNELDDAIGAMHNVMFRLTPRLEELERLGREQLRLLQEERDAPSGAVAEPVAPDFDLPPKRRWWHWLLFWRR